MWKKSYDCVARVSNVVILDPQSCPEIGKKVNEDKKTVFDKGQVGQKEPITGDNK